MIGLYIALGIIGGLIVIALLALLLVEYLFNKMLPKRGDGVLCIDYPFPDEYVNLVTRKISFKSGKNLLRGFVYKNKNINDYKAVVILSHGIGYGHFYLLNMIDYLTSNGYIVLAYDHSASGLSEGRVLNCMSRVSKDIAFALDFKEKDEELRGYKTYLLGHSLGGYAVIQGLNLKGHRVDKCISVAGFNSEADEIVSIFPISKILKPIIKFRIFLKVGKNAYSTSVKKLTKTNTKVLYIQGLNDKVVNVNFAGKKFAKINNENLIVKLIENKGHTPFAASYADEEVTKVLSKLGFLGGVLTPYDFSVDIRKMAEPDPAIYQMILDFFNN